MKTYNPLRTVAALKRAQQRRDRRSVKRFANRITAAARRINCSAARRGVAQPRTPAMRNALQRNALQIMKGQPA